MTVDFYLYCRFPPQKMCNSGRKDTKINPISSLIMRKHYPLAIWNSRELIAPFSAGELRISSKLWYSHPTWTKVANFPLCNAQFQPVAKSENVAICNARGWIYSYTKG